MPLIVTVRSAMPGQRGHGDVDGAVVEDVLVDLVGHGQRVVAAAQVGDRLQLRAREDLARGVVRAC